MTCVCIRTPNPMYTCIYIFIGMGAIGTSACSIHAVHFDCMYYIVVHSEIHLLGPA